MSKNRKIRTTLLVLAIIGLFTIWPLPDNLFNVPYSTVVTDSNDELLAAQIADDGQWRFPAPDSVPWKFEKALILFEDEHFYKHPGINPLSIGRALVQNIREGRVVSGGSTITMQLARLINNSSSRSLGNKLYEALLSLKLEWKYSKDELLVMYASHAPFGGNVVGLESAAWRYYKRPSHQLSWAEAATLAVLPNDPASIFPGKNRAALEAKRNRLLKKIHDRGYISETDLRLSREEKLPGKPKDLPVYGNHLLTRILSEGRKGEQVSSTLQKDLQINVLRKVKHAYESLKNNEIHNAAVIVVEAKTGKVLSYVGNTPTTKIHSPQVDVIMAPRSTGSILKPFLYGMALEEGIIAPNQFLNDIPTFFQGFAPTNFDNTFEGVVRADEALRRSLNVPFVYLLKDYSYEKFHFDLQNCGFTTLSNPADHYGLSLILGGAEVNLWELTGAYASLLRLLERYRSLGAKKNYQEGVVFENKYDRGETSINSSRSHFSAGAAWWTLKAMQGLQRPEDIAGWQNFQSARNISWKTGTSYGFRDAWAVGTDGEVVVGVWVGNADGEGRPGLTGTQAAAPLLFDIFDLFPVKNNFLGLPPAEMQPVEICSMSGLIAGLHCDDKKNILVPQKARLSQTCSFHKLAHFDRSGRYRVTADCYPVNQIHSASIFELSPVQAWYYKLNHSNYDPMNEFLPGCKPGDLKSMEMIYPRRHTKVYVPKEIDGRKGRCVFEVAHSDNDATIFWHLNAEFIGQTKKEHILNLNPAPGKHTLRLIDDKASELELTFEVIN